MYKLTTAFKQSQILPRPGFTFKTSSSSLKDRVSSPEMIRTQKCSGKGAQIGVSHGAGILGQRTFLWKTLLKHLDFQSVDPTSTGIGANSNQWFFSRSSVSSAAGTMFRCLSPFLTSEIKIRKLWKPQTYFEIPEVQNISAVGIGGAKHRHLAFDPKKYEIDVFSSNSCAKCFVTPLSLSKTYASNEVLL